MHDAVANRPAGLLAKALPAIDWLRGYGRKTALADIVAATIVTVMLIPQSLAYALVAGLPPKMGLYASIAPLIAYALFGSSRTLAVGPAAIIAILTATAVGRVAEAGSVGYMTAAITLAALSGLVLLFAGVARLGFVANLLSHPVISGFVTGSALLIAAGQLKHLLGVPIDSHSVQSLVLSFVHYVPQTHLLTAVIGSASIGFLYLVRARLKPSLVALGMRGDWAGIVAQTGPVLAVALSILVVTAFHLGAHGVRLVGDIPRGLPAFTLPAFDVRLWEQLLWSAILISVIGFVESVSLAQTLAAKRRQRIDVNQELIGLGAANIAAGVTGAFPVTGGFARSVVNFEAGAQTQMAGIFTAGGICLTVLFFTPLLYNLPQTVLAATIIVAVLSLVDVREIRHSWAYCKTDFAAMMATIALTLTSGVELGLMTGIGLSLALYIWQTAQPHIAVVGRIPGTEHFRNVLRHKVYTNPNILMLRVDESLYFLNARHLEDFIVRTVAHQHDIKHVVLICSAVNFIDGSALDTLFHLITNLREAGITLHLAEVKGPVSDQLEKVDFQKRLEPGRIFLSTHEAMTELEGALVSRHQPSPAPHPRDVSPDV